MKSNEAKTLPRALRSLPPFCLPSALPLFHHSPFLSEVIQTRREYLKTQATLRCARQSDAEAVIAHHLLPFLFSDLMTASESGRREAPSLAPWGHSAGGVGEEGGRRETTAHKCRRLVQISNSKSHRRHRPLRPSLHPHMVQHKCCEPAISLFRRVRRGATLAS